MYHRNKLRVRQTTLTADVHSQIASTLALKFSLGFHFTHGERAAEILNMRELRKG